MSNNTDPDSTSKSTANSEQNLTYRKIVQKLKFVLEILAALITILPEVVAIEVWLGMLLWLNVSQMIVILLP